MSTRGQSTANGRDDRGRFAVGNPGGPGRPPRAVERDYLATIGDAVPLDVWHKIVEKARDDALEGDAKARAWLASYLLGAALPSLLTIMEGECPDEKLRREQREAAEQRRRREADEAEMEQFLNGGNEHDDE